MRVVHIPEEDGTDGLNEEGNGIDNSAGHGHPRIGLDNLICHSFGPFVPATPQLGSSAQTRGDTGVVQLCRRLVTNHAHHGLSTRSAPPAANWFSRRAFVMCSERYGQRVR
jgi:hypothetical protein